MGARHHQAARQLYADIATLSEPEAVRRLAQALERAEVEAREAEVPAPAETAAGKRQAAALSRAWVKLDGGEG